MPYIHKYMNYIKHMVHGFDTSFKQLCVSPFHLKSLRFKSYTLRN